MCAEGQHCGFEQSSSRSTAARILHETVYQALQVLNYRTFGDTGLSFASEPDASPSWPKSKVAVQGGEPEAAPSSHEWAD